MTDQERSFFAGEYSGGGQDETKLDKNNTNPTKKSKTPPKNIKFDKFKAVLQTLFLFAVMSKTGVEGKVCPPSTASTTQVVLTACNQDAWFFGLTGDSKVTLSVIDVCLTCDYVAVGGGSLDVPSANIIRKELTSGAIDSY